MPHVEIELPYFYEVDYVPPRKRNSVRQTFAGKMIVEIESVTSSEAPLVVSWKEDYCGMKQSGHARSFRDGFYLPARDKPEASFDPHPEEVHPAYERHVLKRYRCGAIPVAAHGPEALVEGRIITVHNRYSVEEGLQAVEAELMQEIRRSAEHCLFVDGMLYRRGRLPTVIAQIDYRFHGPDAIDIRLGEAGDRLGAHGMQFGIGDIGAAVAWGEHRREMEERGEVRCHVDVTVHSPDLLAPGMGLRDEALRVARFIMSRGWKLEELSDGVILRWMDSRRLMKEAAASSDDEDAVTALLDSLEALYEAFELDENERRSSYGSSFSKMNDINYRALAGARAQWEARPISGHDGIPAFRP